MAKLVASEAFEGVPGKYWHAIDDGRIQCDLCPRYCKLRNGQRGLCYVRACQDDGIVLTTYGRSSGFCIDPIEKKPLSHYYPGTAVLSFGTAGCNLTCKFCQNWDISKSREWDTLSNQASPETIANAAKQNNCRSVAFTYNDPVIFHEYAVDVAKACREVDIKTVAVSAGYVTQAPRAEFYDNVDAVNIDLKAFTERFYHDLCTAHLDAVKETLIYIKHETSVWLEITTLLIPGENDGDKELRQLCDWVFEALGPDVPIHFSAFHPEYKMMDKPKTPPETLFKARRIASDHGLRYAYVGNIHDIGRDSTYCHVCNSRLIGRDWYALKTWSLSERGECLTCGTKCAGVFDAAPGTWGRTRKPVNISNFQAVKNMSVEV